jgi:branched-chain amino acid transport system permease protein
MTTSANANGAASSGTISRAIKEGIFAGVLALGLFVLYIGIKTDQNMANELIWYPRWGMLATFVAIAAVGRFAMVAFFAPWMKANKEKKAAAVSAHDIDAKPSFFKTHFLKIALLALILYPPVIVMLTGVQGSLKYVDNFGIQILIYVMLAWGLNIVVGLAGLLDLGYVAFYAVGAYSYALLAQNFGLSFWLLLPLAGILAAFWGIILGFPVLRLRGDYLAIVTLAFGEIIRLVLINWQEFSNGYEGISTIPRPTFFGTPFNASDTGFAAVWGLEFSPVYRTIFLYYVIVCLSLLTAWVSLQLRRLPVGRAWEALREDEIACRSLGINTVNTKLTAFAIGAMFGGFRRFVLRRPPGLHLARELHFHGIGDDPRHRRAGRHGLAHGHRDRRRRHDRRDGAVARARLDEGDLRQRFRSGPVPHAALRSWRWSRSCCGSRAASSATQRCRRPSSRNARRSRAPSAKEGHG